MNTLVEKEPKKKSKYQLFKHPWISLLAVYGATIVSTIFDRSLLWLCIRENLKFASFDDCPLSQ